MNNNCTNNCRGPAPQNFNPGTVPLITNIHNATICNTNFRTTLWTGANLQVTLMCIPPGGDIGLEVHPHLDQFIRIESGQGLVKLGSSRTNLRRCQHVNAGYATVIPAGSWHNLVNVGTMPLHLYSIYAPPEHPAGTTHRTQLDAQRDEGHS